MTGIELLEGKKDAYNLEPQWICKSSTNQSPTRLLQFFSMVTS